MCAEGGSMQCVGEEAGRETCNNEDVVKRCVLRGEGRGGAGKVR